MSSAKQDHWWVLSLDEQHRTTTSPPSELDQRNRPPQFVKANRFANFSSSPAQVLSPSDAQSRNDGLEDFKFDTSAIMVGEQDTIRYPLIPSQGKTAPAAVNADKTISTSDTSQNAAQRVEFGTPTTLGVSAPKQPPESRPTNKTSDSFDHLFAKSRPKAPEFYKPPGATNPLQNFGKLGTVQQPTQIKSSASNGSDPRTLPNHSNQTRTDQDPFVISKPALPSQKHRLPQYPTFSSQSNTNPFFRVKNDFFDSAQPAPSEEGFNDRHVFGNERFGTTDPLTYVDSEKANDNIKALLEGAMDDEEEKPRTRRRKKEAEAEADLSRKMENASLQEDEDNEEEQDDGTREGLKVKLLPHQIEGVEWMLNKELGTKKVKGILPRGGILADDMGLGKTIQSIAVILLNRKPSAADLEKSKRKLDPKTDRATLVVTPLALIKQWEAEIRDRVEQTHALQVLVHHGPQRSKSFKELRKYDVVITTYQTLSSEFIEGGENSNSALYGVNWYRIILDEAHSIKNRNAKCTKAACGLNAEYRWCLTGTPMQNNLDELQSLIHFLQIKPYNNLDVWREQITKPMTNGRGGLSIRRLRAFLSAFMKRRTKDVLKELEGPKESETKSGNGFQIVKRTVNTIEAEFSPQEFEFYQGLQARTDRSLEMMMAGNKLSYANALVLLMRLRQACNHPKLLGTDLAKEQEIPQTPSRKNTTGMDEIANLLGELTVEMKRCDVCQIELDQDAVKKGSLRCDECERDLQGQTFLARKTKPKMPVRGTNRKIVTDSDDEDENDSEHDSESSAGPDFVASTKIRHLIKILQQDSHSHKYIVFSFFTSMLNLIEPFMKHHHIKFVRYDGAMRNDMREASLNNLRNDPTVRVLLCSLRAGSLGLNLTAASRVVILEPFWNPFVEEQAIDRVHRLNQTQDVVVHKLTIKDTVESRIVELQEKKRELANATIEGHKGAGAGKLSLQEMLKLFKHHDDYDPKLDLIGMKDARGLLENGKSGGREKGSKTFAKDDPIYGRRW